MAGFLSSIPLVNSQVWQLVKRGLTHRKIIDVLKELYPDKHYGLVL